MLEYTIEDMQMLLEKGIISKEDYEEQLEFNEVLTEGVFFESAITDWLSTGVKINNRHTNDVYIEYLVWCTKNNKKHCSKSFFGRQITKAGYQSVVKGLRNMKNNKLVSKRVFLKIDEEKISSLKEAINLVDGLTLKLDDEIIKETKECSNFNELDDTLKIEEN